MKECERKSAGSKITFAYTYVAQPLFLLNRKYRQEIGWKIKGNKEIYPIIIRILGITK